MLHAIFTSELFEIVSLELKTKFFKLNVYNKIRLTIRKLTKLQIKILCQLPFFYERVFHVITSFRSYEVNGVLGSNT